MACPAKRALLVPVFASFVLSCAAPAASPPVAPSPPPPAAPVDLRAMAANVFSRASFCPVDRVTVVPVASEPPADIAADPQRAAMWRASLEGQTLYQVEGCGRSLVVQCRQQNSRGRKMSACLPNVEMTMGQR
jgi:hypothetical protein